MSFSFLALVSISRIPLFESHLNTMICPPSTDDACQDAPHHQCSSAVALIIFLQQSGLEQICKPNFSLNFKELYSRGRCRYPLFAKTHFIAVQTESVSLNVRKLPRRLSLTILANFEIVCIFFAILDNFGQF